MKSLGPEITKWLAIALAGAIGATLRGGVGTIVEKYVWGNIARNGHSTTLFPVATLCVNLTGCLVIGGLWQITRSSETISPFWQAVLVVGFLGSLTTFSTFAKETLVYLEEGHIMLAGSNVLLNVVGGLLAVWSGSGIASIWIHK
ncbi:MAG: CrcB family protein [Pirellulaceae bacterium]|nr:CrcB family protein [Pirellulaceae bacterium]